MKIGLVRQHQMEFPQGMINRDGQLLHSSSRDQPGQLIIGNDDGWRLGTDCLPPNFCSGTAADAIKLIRCWPELQPQLRLDSAADFDLDSVAQWLPPVVEPQKVICIGLNYADHAAETGADTPTLPVVFNKFSTSLIGHNQPISLPPISDKVDYEAELVVVIGKPGRNIAIEAALEHVFAYTCGHDVSARDWQKGRPGGQWLLGKTFDSFAPLGPWMVTSDQLTPEDLAVQFRLNDQLLQDSSTKHFIFDVPFLIHHLSKFCTLMPGDLIFSGTPSGVGVARNPPIYLKPGDTAEVEIQGIGKLANRVI